MAVPAFGAENVTLKNAPKDAVVIVHADGKALGEFANKLAGELKKNPEVSGPMSLMQCVAKFAEKIDGIDIYMTMSEGRPGVIALIKTASTAPQLYSLAKDAQLPFPLPKELKAGDKGRYTVEGMPLVIVEGNSAEEIGAGWIAVAMNEEALGTLKAGPNEKLAELAKKVDTSGPVWGVADMSGMPDKYMPASLSGNIYPDGKKASVVTMVYPTEEKAQEATAFYTKNALFKEMASFKQDKANLIVSSMIDDAFIGKQVQSLLKARMMGRQIVSASNLHAIGIGIGMYLATNKGNFPPTLESLIEGDFVSAQGLISPLSGRKVEKDEKGQLKGGSDYAYIALPPLSKLSDTTGLVIAYEKPENAKLGTIAVLYLDGSVKMMTPDDLKVALEKTQKAIKAAQEKK